MYQSPWQQRHRCVQTWDEMTVVVASWWAGFNWISSSRSSSVPSSPRLIAPLCSSSWDCDDDSIPIIKAGRISADNRHSIHLTVNRDNLLEKVTVKLAVRTHLFGKKKIDSTFLFWSWSGYNQTVAGVPQFSFCYKSDVLGQWSTNTTASSSHPTPSSKTGHVPGAWNYGETRVREDFTITEKAPTRAFSWLRAPTSTFTFKTTKLILLDSLL